MRQSPTLAVIELCEFGSRVQELVDAGVTMLHYDIMDGHYVPNLCLPPSGVRELKRRYPEVLLDVHLMVESPENYLELLRESGADRICFHTDATRFAYRLLATIRKLGMAAGVAINPSQRIDSLEPILGQLDYVLYMTVEPGVSGQASLPETLDRLRELVALRNGSGKPFEISVDAGVTPELYAEYCRLGIDIAVTGLYSVYNQPGGIAAACARLNEIAAAPEEAGTAAVSCPHDKPGGCTEKSRQQ